MTQPRPFNALRRPPQKAVVPSPTLTSDEEWEKRLRAHDDAVEAASKPRTLKQKIDSFVFGLISTIIFVGLAFIMTMPELHAFIGQIFVQIFQVSK